MTEWDVVKVIIELVGLAVIVAKAVKSFGERMAKTDISMAELKMSNTELKASISDLQNTIEAGNKHTAESLAKIYAVLADHGDRILALEIKSKQPDA